MSLRYEAWTLPWLGDFKRKVARLPAIEGSGSGGRGLFTTTETGQVSLALGDFPRLDEVISDIEGSLIRVFDGDLCVDEWIGERITREHSDDQVANLQGGQIASVFDKYLVKPYDELNPTSQGDWQWGADNQLAEPGLQTTPKSFELTITATGGTYTLTDGTDTTSAINYDAQAGTIETRIQTDLGLFTDIIVAPAGSSPRKFVLTMVTPPFGVNLGINTGSLTGGTGTTATTEEGGVAFSTWQKAATLARGAPQNVDGYTEFRPSTAQVLSGDYSLLIDAGPSTATSNRWPGTQVLLTVKQGIAQASIPVYPTSGTDKFRLAILGVGEEVIARTSSGGTTLTPNTWNTLSISDFQIPAGVSQVIFRVQCTNPGPSDPSPFYVGVYDAVFYMGLAPSTVGDIATLLLDSRSDLFDWVDYSSFDASTDSNGNAWNEDIALTVQWGQSFGQFFDQLVDLGYEWELVPKATPVGLLTHNLHMYNPGGRDDAPSTAINVKQGVSSGRVVKRIPDYTSVLVEGAGEAWTEDSDPTAEANFGTLEKFLADRQLGDAATRQLAADRLLEFEAANRNAIKVEVTRTTGHPVPLVSYKPGDTIPFQLPPGLPKESRRVQRVDYVNTNPVQYVITGSRLLDGEAAAYNLINRLWRRFNRPQVPEPAVPSFGGGAGGAFTIQIASFEANELEKEKADFVCTGVDDHLVIQAAQALIDSGTYQGARIVLSSGRFFAEPDEIYLTDRQHLQGIGADRTTIVSQSVGSASSILVTVDTSAELSNIGFDTNFGVGAYLGEVVRTIYGRVWNIKHNGACSVGVYVYGATKPCSGWEFIGSYSTAGIYLDEGWVNLTNVTFMPSGSTAGDFMIINSSAAQESAISNLTVSNISAGGRGIVLEGNGKIVLSNFAIVVPDAAIYSDGWGAFGCSFSNGYLEGTQGILIENSSWLSYSSFSNMVIYSAVESGIDIDSARYCTFSDIVIYEPGHHGVALRGASQDNIFSNVLVKRPGRFTDNTYDGFFFGAGVDRNDLRGCRVIGSASTPKPRYGINVSDSSCDDNSYLGCRTGPASDYSTAAYNDSGTGTVNNWPGAAAPQGDNLL